MTVTAFVEQYTAHLKKKAKEVAVLAALNCRAGGTGDDARGESLEGWLRAEMTVMARRKMLTDAGVEYATAVTDSRGASRSSGPAASRIHVWVNPRPEDVATPLPTSRNVVYVQVAVAFNNAGRDAQLARWVRDTDAVTQFAQEQRGGGAVSMLLGVTITDGHIREALEGTAWVVGTGVPICTATGAKVRLWTLVTTFGPSRSRATGGGPERRRESVLVRLRARVVCTHSRL